MIDRDINIKFKHWSCHPQFLHYWDWSPAIKLVDSTNGELIATASVWLDEPMLNGKIRIKTWSENEGMLEALIDAGLVEETEVEIETGYVSAPECQLLQPALDHYEPWPPKEKSNEPHI